MVLVFIIGLYTSDQYLFVSFLISFIKLLHLQPYFIIHDILFPICPITIRSLLHIFSLLHPPDSFTACNSFFFLKLSTSSVCIGSMRYQLYTVKNCIICRDVFLVYYLIYIYTRIYRLYKSFSDNGHIQFEKALRED